LAAPGTVLPVVAPDWPDAALAPAEGVLEVPVPVVAV
jgi:hypothetical protein